VNVFVFPACNEPGLEIIQALRKSNKFSLFGGSSGKGRYDPARFLVEHYVECPYYQAPGFREQFAAILRDCHIDIVFPAWDPLVAVCSEMRVEGVTFVTPRAEIARLLLSKRATYARLGGAVAVPRLYTLQNAQLPLFVKPDQGSGSRGSYVARSRDELSPALGDETLLCEHLPGDEYTVDCISDRSGVLLFANVRVRANIGRGVALGTRPVDEPAVAEQVEAIARALRIEGPWFAQFKKNAAGEPVLLEVNARIGGSMTLTRLGGVNIPLIAAFLYGGDCVRVPRMCRDVVLNRCLRNFCDCAPFDWVVWDLDDTLLRKDGKPDPEVMACLYDLNNRGKRQLLLTRNGNARALLRLYQVPDFFIEVCISEDKAETLAALIARHGIAPERCVMVNDSYSERFVLEAAFPALRVVAPDAVDYLGRETGR